MLSDPKIFKAKCPRCGSIVGLPHEDDVVRCPNCGANLVRKNSRKPELVVETKEIDEEIGQVDLSEIEAEEKWQRDNPDYEF
jgi:DNA-directed RNA polymerase subunit RPC12/RpoP